MTLASRQAREGFPGEVGGILVGWREGDHVVLVHDLLIVADQRRDLHRYDREHRPAEDTLRSYLEHAADARLGYVGEWHSHPAPLPPSALDLKTIKTIASSLLAPVALVVLMAHRDGHSIEPTATIAERSSARTRLHPARISTH